MRKIKEYIGNLLVKILIYLIKKLGKMKYSESDCNSITDTLKLKIFKELNPDYVIDVITMSDNDIDRITYVVIFSNNIQIHFTLLFKLTPPPRLLQITELPNYVEEHIVLNTKIKFCEDTESDTEILFEVISKINSGIKEKKLLLKLYYLRIYNENIRRIIE